MFIRSPLLSRRDKLSCLPSEPGLRNIFAKSKTFLVFSLFLFQNNENENPLIKLEHSMLSVTVLTLELLELLVYVITMLLVCRSL